MYDKLLKPRQSFRITLYIYNSCGSAAQRGPWASPFLRFQDHTQRRTTVGRTPLDEWSARHRDLYLTAHNTHNRQTCRRWDSNPQSQHASGSRPTPWTARPLGAALAVHIIYKYYFKSTFFLNPMNWSDGCTRQLTYCANYQSFIHSPTDAPVSCLKKQY